MLTQTCQEDGGNFMVKITVGVEGMACGMCEAHLGEAVRNAFRVKKVTGSHIIRAA